MELLFGIVAAVVSAGACAQIAKSKNRNELAWMFFGLFTGIVAIAVVLIVRPLQTREVPDWERYSK